MCGALWTSSIHLDQWTSSGDFDGDISGFVCKFVCSVPVKAAGVEVPGVPQSRAWTNRSSHCPENMT